MKTAKQIDKIIEKLERIKRRQATLSRERAHLIRALESGRHEGTHRDLYIQPEGTKIVPVIRNMRRLLTGDLFARCTHRAATNRKASVVAKRKGRKPQ